MNYQEEVYMCGLFKLKKYDRIDLFWGRIKDVERDLIRSFAFIQAFMIGIVCFILLKSDDQTYTGNI